MKNWQHMAGLITIMVIFTGCQPHVFGVSQSAWNQMTANQQQKLMLNYYNSHTPLEH